MRLILAVAFLIVTAVSVVRAQDVATPGVVTYYLHETGTCETGGTEEFADQIDSSGDLDGCGQVGAGAAAGFDVEFPGKEILGNASLDPTSTATAHIFVTTEAPATVSVDLGIAAGPASCTGKSAEETLTNTVALSEYTEFVIDCTFVGLATPTAQPQFSVRIRTQTHFFIGYEDDHASRIEIHGKPVSSGNNSSAPPPTQGTDTPALGLPIVVAFLAAVVVVARRRA